MSSDALFNMLNHVRSSLESKSDDVNAESIKAVGAVLAAGVIDPMRPHLTGTPKAADDTVVWDVLDSPDDRMIEMAHYTVETLRNAVEQYTRKYKHAPPKITLTPAEFVPLAALYPPPSRIDWQELLSGGCYVGCKLFGIPLFLSEEATSVFPQVSDV